MSNKLCNITRIILMITSSKIALCVYQIGPCPKETSEHAMHWRAPDKSRRNSLGSIYINPLEIGTGGGWTISLDVATDGAPLDFVSMGCESQANSTTAVLSYTEGQKKVEINITPLNLNAETFELAIRSQTNSVTQLSVGDDELLRTNFRRLQVPYYTWPIYYSTPGDPFLNVYFDWTHSSSTRIEGTKAFYEAVTNGEHRALNERLLIKRSKTLNNVLPDIPNQKSPFLESLAGRTVIDIASAQFSEIAAEIKELKGMGLGDCVVILHSWTGKGYDNGFPDHVPASESLGGDDQLRQLAQAVEDAGCYIALHENFVDYYPNYSHFSKSEVALSSNGTAQLGWKNGTTGLQAYATKPSAFVAIEASQAHEIQKRYHTNASFVDVNSSAPPWWRVDMDAEILGAGSFAVTEEANRKLWEADRATYKGPVFGEGENHWFWSGLLDGVEAQLFRGADNGRNVSASAPLFVNFDLLKIHPLQINYGMGYYERWLNQPESIVNTQLQDAYRMQEIAYGHAPFIGSALWKSAYHVLQEQNLVSPIAKRYGASTVRDIRYEIKGKWSTTEEAVWAHNWSRILIEYSNGDTIIANSESQPLEVAGLILPQYGWVARGKKLLAYTAFKGNEIVDYLDADDEIFANARNSKDIAASLTQTAVNTSRQDVATAQSKDSRLSNGQVVDFGPLKTDGMAIIKKSGGSWHLKTYPENRPVKIQLSSGRFPVPKVVTCQLENEPKQHPIEISGFWEIKTTSAHECFWQ